MPPPLVELNVPPIEQRRSQLEDARKAISEREKLLRIYEAQARVRARGARQ